MEVLGRVVQIRIKLIQDKGEFLFEFCNIAVRFSVYIVWTSVLSKHKPVVGQQSTFKKKCALDELKT